MTDALFNLPECCYRISVKALIRDDQGRILAVKEGDDAWDLPGGGTDHGEDIVTSLEREIREEVGLQVEVGDFVMAHKFLASNGIHACFLVYECAVTGSNEVVLGDAAEADWLSLDELGTKWPPAVIERLTAYAA